MSLRTFRSINNKLILILYSSFNIGVYMPEDYREIQAGISNYVKIGTIILSSTCIPVYYIHRYITSAKKKNDS
jgi:hypothetical protein